MTTDEVILRREKAAENGEAFVEPPPRLRGQSTYLAHVENEEQDEGATGDTVAQPTLLQLNDDCLEYICQKLTLCDQIRLACVCQRLRCIVQCRCQLKRFKLLEMSEHLAGMTRAEQREFFKIAGLHVETLVGLWHELKQSPRGNSNATTENGDDAKEEEDRDAVSRVAEFYSNKYCPYVRRLIIRCSYLKSPRLLQMLSELRTLREVRLYSCDLTDDAVLALSQLPLLEVLALSGNNGITGQHLNRFSTLKELSIKDCIYLQSKYFIDIWKSLGQLRALNIQCSGTFEPNRAAEGFHELIRYCDQLQVLKISCEYGCVQYERVARLRHLRHLEVYAYTPAVPMRQQIFAALAEMPSLKYLKIIAEKCINRERAALIARLDWLQQLVWCNDDHLDDDCLRLWAAGLQQLVEIGLTRCSAISAAGVLLLMQQCPRLRRINVQCCVQFTNRFVFEAISVLRHRRRLQEAVQQSPRPPPLVWLYVGKTGINEDILKNPTYVAAKSFLKLDFGYYTNVDDLLSTLLA